MIFTGDIALPYARAVVVKEVPKLFHGKSWIGNLEGDVVDPSEILQKQQIVFNDREAIRCLINEFNFIGFAAANNHILDTGNFNGTVRFFKDLDIRYSGIGKNLREAANPLVLQEANREIVILNFGWEVIQCEIAKHDQPGVNPLEKEHVLQTVKNALNSYPGAVVIPFMHWSYELEDTPQPFERELARKVIDMGVAGVIGCHPHRIGGFELYNGKPILYSLGNWMFKQNYYHDGKLAFPDFCNNELAFEWDFENNQFLFHFFEYNKYESTLQYINSEGVDSATMKKYTPFQGLSNQEYKSWYKANHYHKNKGLPVYYWEDSQLVVKLKNRINKIRDFFITQLSKFR